MNNDYDPRLDDETVNRLQTAFDPTDADDDTFGRADALSRLAREHAEREANDFEDAEPIFPFRLSDGRWVVEGETDTIPHGRDMCREFIRSVTYVGDIADDDDLDVDGETCPDCGYDRCEVNSFDNGVVGGHVVECRLCGRVLREVAP